MFRIMMTTALAVGIATGAMAQTADLDHIGADANAPKQMLFMPNTFYSNSSGNEGVAAAFQGAYEAFAAAHPDWYIELQGYDPNNSVEVQKLVEAGFSGDGPGCVYVDSFRVPFYKNLGLLKDLSPYFSQEDKDDLFPFVRNLVSGPNGEIFSWWVNTDVRMLYRRTDIIPDAPETWDELKAAARVAKEMGMGGLVVTGARNEATTFDWLAHFWAQGGKLLDDQGKPIFGEGENRQKMINAFNLYGSMAAEGLIPQSVVSFQNQYRDVEASIINGTAAMSINGHWGLANVIKGNPDLEGKWAGSKIPGPEAGMHASGVGGWTIASMSDDEEQQQMCATLIKEVHMDGVIQEYMKRIPTQKSMFDKVSWGATPHFTMVKEVLEDGVARPGFAVYPAVSEAIYTLMADVISGSKTAEKATDEAFKAALTAVNKL
jgi:multiple sugar transport system substrate-binding protein